MSRRLEAGIGFDPNNVESIRAFAKDHVIELNPSQTGCVDPRRSRQFFTFRPEYVKRPEHTPDAVRRPGASFGYVMVLLGADMFMDPRQAVDLIVEWEERNNRKFIFHEDDHASHSHDYASGCGHIDKAMRSDNESLYGISSEKVRDALEHVVQLPKMKDATAQKEVVCASVLTGSHREEGVLVVLSEDRTIDPVHPGVEFFRHDKLQDNRRLDSLAKFLEEKGISITREALQRASDRQLQATLKLLAQGLPVYEIDLLSGLQVDYQGRVE